MKYLVATAAVAISLMGCTDGNGGPPSFGREAGSQMDMGTFGNSTMNNTLVQTGQSTYRIDLARRFAEETQSTVTFPFNSTTLDETARATLRQQAQWIRQFPEVRFTVYGHTDLVGSQAYNRRLGLRRAQAVVLYLATQGIDQSRLDAVVSHGETQPLIVTEGRERRNRRTVTDVSGFVERHPTVMNGRYGEVVFREYVASAVPDSTLTGGQGGSGGIAAP
jgi:peptidoglycan-associated lipoprotein